MDMGERYYADLGDLHPAVVDLAPEVRVELHGRFRDTSPYVDDAGTVHLWRFSTSEGGYRAMFAHELAHAIAFDHAAAAGAWEPEDAGFYIEGWAEYAALLVDPDKTGFPLFGFEEDVVVGHWLEHGGIGLADLRARHEELNMPCQGQAYILRASWYRYVDEVLGHDVLLGLVPADDALTRPVVEAILGDSLDTVDARWEAWAQSRYDAIPDAAEQAAAYRARMDRWYEPCVL